MGRIRPLVTDLKLNTQTRPEEAAAGARGHGSKVPQPGGADEHPEEAESPSFVCLAFREDLLSLYRLQHRKH